MPLGSPPPPIPAEEFAARRTAVAADAAARGLDGLLVWSTGGSALDGYGDAFYLTNHYPQVPRVNVDIPPFMTGWGHTAVIVPAVGEATLVVESQDWRRDLVHCDRVRDSHDLHGEVAAALRAAGLAGGRVGLVGASVLPLTAWRRLQDEAAGTAWEPADDLLAARRMRKSRGEIEHMRHASAVGAAMQTAMLSDAKVGETDADLVRRAMDVALEHGAVPWDFAFASGPHAGHGYWGRLPAWDRHRRYEPGDLVHPDAYGSVEGYFYDLQRSRVIGADPTPAQLRLLDGVVDCVRALCDACRPGVPLRDVALLRQEWLQEHGFADDANEADQEQFIRQLAACGHGIGLGFELPWVDGREQEVLEAGMTIALEVYLSDVGVGTTAFEHVVHVTDGEPEILTLGCPERFW